MTFPPQIVEIDYVNWRGERGLRRIVPQRLAWENSEWHRVTQGLLYALDVDKGAERSFALKDVHGWKPFAEMPAGANEWLAHCRRAGSCSRHGQRMCGCKLSGHPKLGDWMREEVGRIMDPLS